MHGSDTKERILNVAERLFGEEGFAGTSLRAVTAAAGVNLAAVNYYFRSKEALFEAIIQRRVGWLATERLRHLDALKTSGQASSLERLLTAYLTPSFEMLAREGEQDPVLMRFVMRLISDSNPQIQSIVIAAAQEMATQYMEAFAQVLPHLSPQELWWRFRTLNIVASFHPAATLDSALIAGQWLPHAPITNAVNPGWLITFLMAGLQAPATMAVSSQDDGQQSPDRG